MGRDEASNEKAICTLKLSRDLRNRLQMLKQGKISVDEYYKEMELLVWTRIREDPE
jgi:hypothetical protein